MKDLTTWSKMTVCDLSNWSQAILNFHAYLLKGFFVIQFKIRRWPMQVIVGIRNLMAVFSNWK